MLSIRGKHRFSLTQVLALKTVKKKSSISFHFLFFFLFSFFILPALPFTVIIFLSLAHFFSSSFLSSSHFIFHFFLTAFIFLCYLFALHFISPLPIHCTFFLLFSLHFLAQFFNLLSFFFFFLHFSSTFFLHVCFSYIPSFNFLILPTSFFFPTTFMCYLARNV